MKETVKQQIDKPLTQEQAVEYIQNINLAYKDLSEKQLEKEEKLRKFDPEKAEQIERLGMGFIEKSSSHISHSAIGDMKTIEQVNPHSTKSSVIRNLDRDLDILDIDSPFSSRSSKKNSSYGEKDDFWDCLNQYPSASTTSSSSRSSKVPQVIDTIPALETSPTRISRPAMAFGSSAPSNPSNNSSSSASQSYSHPMDSEAQKKFGSAKAISSAQFFGDQTSSSYEEKTRLNQFQGASSLSSDEYFGRNTNKQPNAYSNISGANLYDIKEGVKDSVTKVAGRLSNLASDVMSSIQEKYGGY